MLFLCHKEGYEINILACFWHNKIRALKCFKYQDCAVLQEQIHSMTKCYTNSRLLSWCDSKLFGIPFSVLSAEECQNILEIITCTSVNTFWNLLLSVRPSLTCTSRHASIHCVYVFACASVCSRVSVWGLCVQE